MPVLISTEQESTQEVKVEENIVSKSSINTVMEENTNSKQDKQGNNMQTSNNELQLDNVAVLEKEQSVIEQTIIQSAQNIIKYDEDETTLTLEKKENEYFTLPIDNIIDIKNIESIKKTNNDDSMQNIQVQQKAADEMLTPAKIIADYVFLLGRLTTKEIRDFDGNIIIPNNTLVTAKIVLLAFEKGKLLDLTKYSKS